jgi:lipoprotein NlpD
MPTTRFARRLLLAAVLALLAGCASNAPRDPRSSTYTVKKGDTLYSIAWRNRLDYRELAKWNGIGSDYAIRPGQVLRLFSSASNRTVPRVAARGTPPVNRPATQPRVAIPTAAKVDWQWPVSQGTAVLTNRPNGGQGLNISGAADQEIRAAASGLVVYKGAGLLGYGQLVIVKHNDVYLSAYGHTQTVLVDEGSRVRGGQPIATMGRGPNGTPLLYFEIRVNGEPVDPTPLLPPR